MNLKSLAKDGITYGFANALSRLGAIIAIPFYTRLLSVEDFGIYDLYITVYILLKLLADSQFISGIMRYYYEAEGKQRLNRLIGSSITYYFMTVSGIILLALGLHFTHTLSHLLLDLKYLLPLLIGLLPALFVQLFMVIARMRRKPVQYMFLVLFYLLTQASLGISSLYVLKIGVQGVLWAIALCDVIFGTFSLILILRTTGIRISFSYMKELIHYSLPILPVTGSSWLRNYASRFFIIAQLSVASLGIFGVLTKTNMAIFVFIMAFRQSWEPYAIELFSQKDSESWFPKAFRIYSFTLGLVFAGLVILTPALMALLSPPKYWGFTYILPILMLTRYIEGSSSVLTMGNAWAKKTYANLPGSFIGVGVLLGMLYFGTGKFGLIWVAIWK